MAATRTLSVLSILVALLANHCNCDLFTALADLEGTLRLELSLAQNLRTYVETEQKRLAEISK